MSSTLGDFRQGKYWLGIWELNKGDGCGGVGMDPDRLEGL